MLVAPRDEEGLVTSQTRKHIRDACNDVFNTQLFVIRPARVNILCRTPLCLMEYPPQIPSVSLLTSATLATACLLNPRARPLVVQLEGCCHLVQMRSKVLDSYAPLSVKSSTSSTYHGPSTTLMVQPSASPLKRNDEQSILDFCTKKPSTLWTNQEWELWLARYR